MTNNDILRRLRYTFDLNDNTMIEIFGLGDLRVSRALVSDWMKPEDDPMFVEMFDDELAMFLNGLIIKSRGKKDGPPPMIEQRLNNNVIFRKLRIALAMKDDEVLTVLDLAGMTISKHELSALFRKPGQPQYKRCNDQLLRNFLHGLQLKHKGK